MIQSNISEWPRRLLWYLENRFLTRWRLTTLWPVDSESSIQRSLLRLLSIAHSERLDVAVLVKNFADEHRGMWKYRLRRLAKRINSGTSLVNALEHTPDVLSPSQVLAIRFATQSGTLDRTYEQLLEHPIDDQFSTLKQASVYGFSVLLAIILVLQFLSTFIIPTLKKLSEEFGLDIPPVMQSFMGVHDQINRFGGLWILIFVAIACGLLLSSMRRRILNWISPWWTRISTQSRSAELLRMLAISTDAGRPLAGSLSVLARYHFDREVRSRLLFARNELEQGAEPWECLERASFLNQAEAEAIRSASDLRLQAWTLNQIAIAKTRTLSDQRGRLAALAMPAVTIVASAFVLWVAIAFIQHLATLIQSLA